MAKREKALNQTGGWVYRWRADECGHVTLWVRLLEPLKVQHERHERVKSLQIVLSVWRGRLCSHKNKPALQKIQRSREHRRDVRLTVRSTGFPLKSPKRIVNTRKDVSRSTDTILTLLLPVDSTRWDLLRLDPSIHRLSYTAWSAFGWRVHPGQVASLQLNWKSSLCDFDVHLTRQTSSSRRFILTGHSQIRTLPADHSESMNTSSNNPLNSRNEI